MPYTDATGTMWPDPIPGEPVPERPIRVPKGKPIKVAGPPDPGDLAAPPDSGGLTSGLFNPGAMLEGGGALAALMGKMATAPTPAPEPSGLSGRLGGLAGGLAALNAPQAPALPAGPAVPPAAVPLYQMPALQPQQMAQDAQAYIKQLGGGKQVPWEGEPGIRVARGMNMSTAYPTLGPGFEVTRGQDIAARDRLEHQDNKLLAAYQQQSGLDTERAKITATGQNEFARQELANKGMMDTARIKGDLEREQFEYSKSPQARAQAIVGSVLSQPGKTALDAMQIVRDLNRIGPFGAGPDAATSPRGNIGVQGQPPQVGVARPGKITQGGPGTGARERMSQRLGEGSLNVEKAVVDNKDVGKALAGIRANMGGDEYLRQHLDVILPFLESHYGRKAVHEFLGSPSQGAMGATDIFNPLADRPGQRPTARSMGEWMRRHVPGMDPNEEDRAAEVLRNWLASKKQWPYRQ